MTAHIQCQAHKRQLVRSFRQDRFLWLTIAGLVLAIILVVSFGWQNPTIRPADPTQAITGDQLMQDITTGGLGVR